MTIAITFSLGVVALGLAIVACCVVSMVVEPKDGKQ